MNGRAKINSIKFKAKLEHLPEAFSWIHAQVGPASLTPPEKKKVELALEEAIVNIIEHGAKQQELEITLSCRFEAFRQIEFVLLDNGAPFNPLIEPEVNRAEIPLEEQKIGGVGILLMKQCMDAVFYRREEELNELTLVKNLNPNF